MAGLDARMGKDSRAVTAPQLKTFREFLEKEARVPVDNGEYAAFSFEGREALEEFVDTIDHVLGSTTGERLKDAELALCGGAQFGKTTTELNLGAYVTSQSWLRWGFYLPDDDLVQGIVDSKLRPDVIDQIGWFADMTKVGKAVNKSGKAVNRKGAFMVTDGKHQSYGMVLGLNKKPPTSFTFDVATLDEVDDIDPKREKYVRGRMTSSKVRLLVKIGTQRIAGRGQHKAWKEGSQGVMMHRCPSCAHEQNLEEQWPRCCRVQMGPTPVETDPHLTQTGDFRHEDTGSVIAVHDPRHTYYFACGACGAKMDRSKKGFRWVHRRSEAIRLYRWSWRISQMGIAAIDVSQIVAHWTKAVIDPLEMEAFNCDRRAMPESSDQKITEAILDRARQVSPYDMATRVQIGCEGFAGLDTGRRCWLAARERQRVDVKRMLHIEQIAVGNVVERAVSLFNLLGLSCLLIDQNPETDAARTIALRLNGLAELKAWPKPPKAGGSVKFPGGLQFDGERWRGLRCAVVAFNVKKRGGGIRHSFDIFEKDGREVFVPLIECNRYEMIDRAVKEFLTPAENVQDVIQDVGGARIRTEPAMRLPRRGRGSPKVLELLDEHLLTGSEKEEGESGDYVDKCENHFLLANGYAALAEAVAGGEGSKPIPPAAKSVPMSGPKRPLGAKPKGVLV